MTVLLLFLIMEPTQVCGHGGLNHLIHFWEPIQFFRFWSRATRASQLHLPFSEAPNRPWEPLKLNFCLFIALRQMEKPLFLFRLFRFFPLVQGFSFTWWPHHTVDN